MIQIAVLNHSTVVGDSEMPKVVEALQKQVERDFAPAWNINATLRLASKEIQPARTWQLIILDDSTQADALGFHEVTSEGLPIGYCFAKSTMEDGGQWTVTASHELLEMLADPEINQTVFVQDSDTTGKLYAMEVADAVEETTYEIDSIPVSDFVLPSYFEPGTATVTTPQGPFDFMKQLAKPLPALLAGGYIGEFTVGQGSGWAQITDQRIRHARQLIRDGSRRHRRMLPRHHWRRSER